MTIKLLYKYIEYDVRQLTLRYSNVRFADNSDLADLSAFGENESDQALINRFCVTGVAKMKQLLHSYLDKKNTSDADDTLNNTADTTSWQFHFNADCMIDADAAAGLMHWYVVKWCVWQWSLGYSPNEAPLAKQELDNHENELRSLLADSAIPMKTKRKIHNDETELDVVVEYNTLEPEEPEQEESEPDIIEESTPITT